MSHRTRFPYLGTRHDLHAAARDWLARHGFHDPAGIGLPVERVFFEETKEAKLARIAAVGCTHFVDDLPELLAHPLFPQQVRRILFDPGGLHARLPGVDVATSWSHVSALVAVPPRPAIGPLLAAAGLPPALAIDRLAGSGNNRVYRVETASGPALLKEYFRHAADPRDRLGAEQAFSRFAWEHGIRSLPRPLGCDRAGGLGLYEFVAGRKLAPGEVTAAHVDQAAAFFVAVNRHRGDPAAAALPVASEACFSLAEHLACVDRRIARLAAIEPESALHCRAAAVVAERLVPAWQRVRAAVVASGLPLDEPLAPGVRVISPSDFGFHNCLMTTAGLKFIDFEYAGWDDPAKTVCDFFCQPAVPVPHEHFERFLAAAAAMSLDAAALRERVSLLFPVYELKWCCIMMNEFLPVGDERRAFAHGADTHVASRHDQLQRQLEKVAIVLGRLEA